MSSTSDERPLTEGSDASHARLRCRLPLGGSGRTDLRRGPPCPEAGGHAHVPDGVHGFRLRHDAGSGSGVPEVRARERGHPRPPHRRRALDRSNERQAIPEGRPGRMGELESRGPSKGEDLHGHLARPRRPQDGGQGRATSPDLKGKRYDDPLVMKAYLSYCRRAVEFFKPDYLAIGIETNEIHDAGAKTWRAYVTLHERPDLPV